MRDLHICLNEGTVTSELGYKIQFLVTENTITGNSVLVNKVLKKLLTTIGTDAFSPLSGADLKTYLQGSNINDLLSLSQAITNTLNIIADEIKLGEVEFYPIYFNTDDSMHLNTLSLSDIYKRDVGYDRKGSGIVISILITAVDGSHASVKLGIDDINTSKTENTANKIYDTMQRATQGLN